MVQNLAKYILHNIGGDFAILDITGNPVFQTLLVISEQLCQPLAPITHEEKLPI